MTSYPINLETFSKIVGYDNEAKIDKAETSKQINFETKKELITLISWFIKEITKQKEKEILNTNKLIANTLNNLDSYLKKISLYTENLIRLSEAILLSDTRILNTLYMTKEEAIYVFTKYIHKSDWWFRKPEFMNSSEIYHYCNLKQKAESDIETKISFANRYESFVCPEQSIQYYLKIFDVLYLWERLNGDLKFVLDLYGENGKYSFIRKHEPELDVRCNYFLARYNLIKEHYLPREDIIPQKIAFNNLDRSNCIYNCTSWKDYTNIIIYNIASKSIVSKTLEFRDNCPELSFIVKLPDFNLFLYRENFYIVDTLNFSIKMIASPINHKFTSGLYYENCIYLFERDEALGHHYIYKYNLVSNKLSKLSTLTKDLTVMSCVIYKNSIFFSWYQNNDIYKYDINIESYSYLRFKLDKEGRNYFFSIDEKLIVFNEWDKIYEMQDDEYHLLPICKLQRWEKAEMSYIWKKDMIYIGLIKRSSMEYYGLDLKLKRLLPQTIR